MKFRFSFLALALLLAAPAASAADDISLTLKNHRFSPAEIHVKAGTRNLIVLHNEDATPDEFDSTALKVEKIVPGHSSSKIRLRPLSPGKYPFMGEYHAATARGVVIAE